MPYSTTGQEWIFLGCLAAGLLMGLVYEAGFILRFCFNALFKESKALPPSENSASKKIVPDNTANKGQPRKNKFLNAENLPSVIFSFATDILFFAAYFVIILFSAKITGSGQIFWFSAAAYILGFIFERITIGIIVAKFINMIYNTLAKVFGSLKKLKIFGRLFR